MKKIILLSGVVILSLNLCAQGKKDKKSTSVTVEQSADKALGPANAPLLKKPLDLSANFGFKPSEKLQHFYKMEGMDGFTRIHLAGEFLYRRMETLEDGSILDGIDNLELSESKPLVLSLHRNEDSRSQVMRYLVQFNGEDKFMDVAYFNDLGVVVFNLIPRDSDELNSNYWNKLLELISESGISTQPTR